jgi:hypothetical protein
MITADLANRTKHFQLDRNPRVGATPKKRILTLTTDRAVFAGATLPGDPPPDRSPVSCVTYLSHQIELDDGSSVIAQEVAESAYKDWLTLLQSLGLL